MKKALLPLLLGALLLTGAGCFGGGRQVQIKPVSLEYWRTGDDPETLSEVIASYQKIHPNVEIIVRRMRDEDYEKLLLEALAEDRGPDIFSIPNVWLAAWREKILVMPKETTIPTQEVTPDKKIVTVNKKTPAMTILQMRNEYIEAINKQLIRPYAEDPLKPAVDRIYAMAYSADTLALFYNRDLLKRANIEKPPQTWTDLQGMAGRLTVLDKDTGDIKQSGAAIGWSENVLYNVDILSAIMEQNGAVMTDEGGYARFHEFATRADRVYPPGVEAVQFYQTFTVPNTPGYSWNESMPNSLDAFITGRTAFFFGFPGDMKRIRERAPKLDVGIAPLPQVDPTEPKNVARFPIEVVSKKTESPNEAWDFLQFAARAENVVTFLSAAKRPTALRALIDQQLTDPDVAPFAGQVLTASSWYRGADYKKVEEAFAYMIENRPTFENADPIHWVSEAAGMVNATVIWGF